MNDHWGWIYLWPIFGIIFNFFNWNVFQWTAWRVQQWRHVITNFFKIQKINFETKVLLGFEFSVSFFSQSMRSLSENVTRVEFFWGQIKKKFFLKNRFLSWFQIQNDKDKILYELDELQSQLEKAQVSWPVCNGKIICGLLAKGELLP